MKLYEIDSKIRELLDRLYENTIDPETGEILDDGTTYADLEANIEERNQKLENIGLYLKELDASIEAYEKEQDRIKAKIKSLKNKHKNIENYVITSMQAAGEKKFESLRAEMSIRESESVNVDESLDVRSLPEQYVKVKTEYSPDKIELKKALKKGEIIDGVTMGVKYNLICK